MASEGFDDEEWDADFIDGIEKALEEALSSQTTHQNNHLPTPTPTLAPSRPPPRFEVSYSPPRELSQRTYEGRTGCIPDSFSPPRTHIAKEHEVDILKVNIMFEFTISVGMRMMIHWETLRNLNVLACGIVWFLLSADCKL